MDWLHVGLQLKSAVRPGGKLIPSAVAEEQVHFLANLTMLFYTLNVWGFYFNLVITKPYIAGKKSLTKVELFLK